jgi:hypothetical protein
MVWKPPFQFKHQQIAHNGALKFDSFDCLIKTFLHNCMMVVGQGINIRNHVGLFSDAKNQVFFALI